MSRFDDYVKSRTSYMESSNPWISGHFEYIDVSIERFLRLKKQTQDQTKENQTTSNSNSKDTNNLSSDKLTEILGENGKEILNQVHTEVSKKYLQMYYNQYMAPIGDTDIKYRLGQVTGVVNNFDTDADNYSPYIQDKVKNYDDEGIVRDKFGRIYTRSNFALKIPVKYFDTTSERERSFNEVYTNCFFPPYKFGYSLISGAETSSLYNHWRSLNQGRKLLYNLETFKSSRSGFTYREPAFKSINDNITFLQFILEQVSGMVSTYLTEWDLSVYMQEGLIPNSSETGYPPVIWLTNRIKQDNPLTNNLYKGYYADNRALAFGVCNAAVSKLFGDNQVSWIPNYYPLSTYWTPYFSLNDFVTGNAITTREVVRIISDGKYVDVPSFYYPDNGFSVSGRDTTGNYNYTTANWKHIQEYYPFRLKMRLTDERNAALSAWTSWDGLRYYNAFYTTSEDGLSDSDVLMKSIDKKTKSVDKILLQLRSHVINMGGCYKGESTGGNALTTNIPNYDISGAESNYNGTITANTSSGSDPTSSAIRKLTNYLLHGTKDDSGADSNENGRNDSNDFSSGESNIDNESLTIADMDDSGFASANTMLSSLTDTPGAKSVSIKANSVGIPQHNPPLFGGPHGAYASPKTPQSYFEPANPFLRDVPRANNNVSAHNSFTSTYTPAYKLGNEQYYECPSDTQINVNNSGSLLNYYSGQDTFGKSDFSPSLTLHNLKEGHYNYVIDYTTITKRVYGFYYGEIRYTYSPCSSYFYWPSYHNGLPLTYLEADTGQYGYRIHYMEYLPSQTMTWYEGAYYSYLNENARTSRVWMYGRQMWRIETYGPCRYGYTTQIIKNYYKRYFIHNEPYLRWSITQFKPYQWVSENQITWFSYFWHALANWFYGRTVWYFYYAQSAGLQYKLHFPWSGLTSIDNMTVYGTSYLETEALRFCSKFMTGGNYNSTDVYFLEGTGQSYSSRFNYGPESIFKARVTRNYYSIPYWYVHYRCKCGRPRFHCFQIGFKTTSYLRVTFLDDFFIDNIRNSSYLNVNNLKEFEKDNIPDSYRKTRFHPLQKAYYSWNNYTRGWNDWNCYLYGLNGWGILQNIQGIAPSYIENPFFINYSSLMTTGGSVNTPIKDIRFKYTYIVGEGYPYQRNPNTGMIEYVRGGLKQYGIAYCDAGLNRVLQNYFSRATFYKKNNVGYYVDISNGFRTLIQQIYWQLSFLEYAESVFINNIDFKVIRHLIRGYIDESYTSTAKHGYDYKNKLNYTDETFYDYWLMKAIDDFDQNDDVLVWKKEYIRSKLKGRIKSLRNLLPALKRVSRNSIKYSSFNEIGAAYSSVQLAYNQVNEVTDFENYLMEYLEVLYLYRRYFINKRFNKQDGTMWGMRQLESCLPMMLANLITTNMPEFSAISKQDVAKPYMVAYYDLTNSVADKMAAAAKVDESQRTILDEDRITTVYIKVKYVTEDDYKSWLDSDAYKTGTGEKIVWIKERQKYAIQPMDTSYFLDSQERINSINNIEYNKKLKAQLEIDFAESAIDESIRMRNINNAYESQKKYVQDIDNVTWEYIQWGNSKSLTPIFFGVTDNVDVSVLNEMVSSGMTKENALEALCGSRVENDYWTVRIPKTLYPRRTGYINKVKIVPVTGNYTNTKFGELDEETTVNGVMSYQLWPITEEQAEYTPGDNKIGDIKEQILDLMNSPQKNGGTMNINL